MSCCGIRPETSRDQQLRARVKDVWETEGSPVQSLEFQIASGCIRTVNLASLSYIFHSAVTGNQLLCF